MKIKYEVNDAKSLDKWITMIGSTPGLNDKKLILNNTEVNDFLVSYLQAVYDEVNYVYGKSKLPIIPVTQSNAYNNDNDLLEMFSILDNMKDGVLKGKSADQKIIDYLVGKDELYTRLFSYALKRDIKAKISVKIINDTLGRIIEIVPYMRCESESYMKKRIVYSTDGVKHGALAQTKADGAFLNVVIEPKCDEVQATTRQGRLVPDCLFLNSLSNIKTDKKIVLHGEILIKDESGNILPREISNGMFNKFVKHETTLLELDKKISLSKSEKAKEKLVLKYNTLQNEIKKNVNNMVYVTWDILPYEEWLNLECDESTITRFNNVKSLVEDYNLFVEASDLNIDNCELQLIDYKIVHDDEEAIDFYNDQLSKGLEGMVIKNLNIPWKHDVNRGGIIKLKDFKECDLTCVGWEPAKEGSEFEGGIGSLICESEDGLLKVNISGMKRNERGLERLDPDDSSKGLKIIDDFDFDQFNSKIIAVKFNEITKSKSKDEYSLFLPSILEIRDSSDKSQADSWDKIKKDAKYKG